MKKILLSFGLLIAFGACNQQPEGYTLEGTLTGDLDDGTLVFLRKVGDNNQPVDIDTSTVTKGKFVFEGGPISTPEMHYIFVDKLNGYTAVILENGNIRLNAQKDSLGMAKISGTEQNEVFVDFIDKSQEITKKAMSIQGDLQQAQLNQNEASITSLGDEMKELQEESKNFELEYIKGHPNALISVLLLERVMASRAVPLPEIEALVAGLTPEIMATSAGKKVLERLIEMKTREASGKNTTLGAKAPEFSAPTPDGQTLALSEAMGKVTLIDFWAAWCKPCRAENPNVVKVYEKYHDKGLNIIGVSLDKKAEDWKKAINDDGLTWGQVSNLAYFEDEVAKLYNVDAIPAAFLLDENGIIIAKNLRGAELETKVAELLD